MGKKEIKQKVSCPKCTREIKGLIKQHKSETKLVKCSCGAEFEIDC